MKIKITKRIYDAIEIDVSSYFGGYADRLFSYQKIETIDLARLTDKRLDTLEELLGPHSRLRGGRAALRDIETFRKLRDGDTSDKPRSVEVFADILTEVLRQAPGHRLYKKEGDLWFAYYVDEVEYHPPRRERDYHHPPTCEVRLIFNRYGERRLETLTFRAEAVLHRSVMETLAGENLYLENDELRANYLEELEKHAEIADTVGLRVHAVGNACADLDGNPDKYRWNRDGIELDPGGVPAMGVIDVYRETAKDRDGHEPHLHVYFWQKSDLTVHGEDPDFDEDDDEEGLDLDDAEEIERLRNPEIPVHPYAPFFDFVRHLRLSVHITRLEVAAYDTGIGDHLVLPKETTDLVDVLMGSDLKFRDIVGGKSGGTIILCAGPPGVGKTLTSEVYSETVERPLFSVQCSQLGIKASHLEDELLKIFVRASRWNAILLLDEADVYIAKRGTDLNQNAIVGVFLRVLEYYSGVLFLTTNRGDTVDDAIASRCIARIDYSVPTPREQARIWWVLSKTSGIELDPGLVEAAIKEWPGLTGRDVKNLLKLSAMIKPGVPVEIDTVRLAKRFKPTEDASKGPRTRKKRGPA